MNTKKTPDDPISTDSGTATEDAHLVDEVLQQHSEMVAVLETNAIS